MTVERERFVATCRSNSSFEEIQRRLTRKGAKTSCDVVRAVVLVSLVAEGILRSLTVCRFIIGANLLQCHGVTTNRGVECSKAGVASSSGDNHTFCPIEQGCGGDKIERCQQDPKRVAQLAQPQFVRIKTRPHVVRVHTRSRGLKSHEISLAWEDLQRPVAYEIVEYDVQSRLNHSCESFNFTGS